MAGNVYKQYVWLLDLISRYDGITFRQIDEHWRSSSLNEDGAPLSKRTFHNHINKIEQMFDIEIGAGAGYKYYINYSGDIDMKSMQQSLLAHIQMSNALFANPRLADRIWLDGFLSFRYYNPLIQAMERGVAVELLLFGGKIVVRVEPYYIKQFATEWFLVGRDRDGGEINAYAFSNIISIRESLDGAHFELPSDFSIKEFLALPKFGKGANNSNDLYIECHFKHKYTTRRGIWASYIPEGYRSKIDAIYVHGLASGAKSSTFMELQQQFAHLRWMCVDFGEDLEQNVEHLNQMVEFYKPKLIVGTSMGGLETLFVNAPNTVKVVCNPALSLANFIRNSFGLGTHNYRYSRKDGVQQFDLTEQMCIDYEHYIATHPILLGQENHAIFALHDELLGDEATLEARRVLSDAGYTVFVDPHGEHRFSEGTFDYLQREVIPHLPL